MNRKLFRMTPDEFFSEFKDMIYVRVLSELAGMNYAVLLARIRHDVSRGCVYRFSEKHILILNKALDLLAEKISAFEFDFNPYLSAQKGMKVGLSVIPQFKVIGRLLRIKNITMKALGWNSSRYDNVVVLSSSKIYGHIKADDCDRLNIELKKIAAYLSNIELVMEEEKTPEHEPVTPEFLTEEESEQFFSELNADRIAVEENTLNTEAFWLKWNNNPILARVRESEKLYVDMAFDAVRDHEKQQAYEDE